MSCPAIIRRVCLFATTIAFLLCVAFVTPDVVSQDQAVAAQDDVQFTAEQLEFFEKRIRPVLAERCYHCHGPEKQESGLRVDSRAALLAGGDSGPSLVPGDVDDGYFVDAVRYGDIYQMPKDGKLPQEQIDDLVAWVKMGAPWPKEAPPSAMPSPKEEFDLVKRARHWSFLPLAESNVPTVSQTQWPRDWIDHFTLAKLESAGIEPSPEADRATWLRRVTFDLTGLPPTPQALQDFLADDSEQAYERVVDRLLDSPQYGERWARHWLDLVRYAETAGHEFDFDIPLAYRYRDYVVRAFNTDVPYDQFVREHIAGDLLPEPRRSAEGNNESIQATGFWWLGEGKHSPVDVRGEEADRMDNQLDVFGKAFLGLTIACARCHDHKFDAISTRDYYALAGYLQSSRYHEVTVDPPETRQQLTQAIAELLPERDKLQRETFLSAIDQDDLANVLLAVRAAVVKNTSTALESALESVSEDDLKPWLAQKLRPEDARRWAAASAVFGVSDQRLIRARNESVAAARHADHPLAVWSYVALCGRAHESGIEAPKTFATRWQQFGDKVQRSPKPQQRNSTTEEVYANFAAGVPADWFVTDEAFGAESQIGERTVWSGTQPPQAIPPGVVHSGRVSHRLQGTLRSPTFEIRSPQIFYRIAGRGAKLNLIVDGFQRIRNPIYGGLTIGLNHDPLQWHRQDVSKWIGHRAYVEIIDHGDGWAAIEEIRFGDQAPADSSRTNIVLQLLAEEVPTNASELAGKLAESFQTQSTEQELAWLANSGLVAPMPQAQVSTELKRANAQLQQLSAQIKYGRRALAMIDGSAVNEFVFLRGNHKTPGDLVHRRFLEAFCNDLPDSTGSGRLELAERMLNESGDLIARVMVNRIWQHHFGRALAATPDNLGRLGDEPSHPELLDALALKLIQGGWKLKPLHRTMVLSATYRQQSEIRPELASVDPVNRLWHRMPVQRLEAEAIRDAILSVSGRLDLATTSGPSVPTHLTPFMQGRGRPGKSGPLDGAGRRSLYLSVRRNFLNPFLTAFDFPTPFTTMGRRSQSNVPAQSLAMMNDPFVLAESKRWAERTLQAHPTAADASSQQTLATKKSRLQTMYLAAFARPATVEETSVALGYLAELEAAGTSESDRWAELAHALFNAKEFIYVR